jgi:hypothetical protein
VEDVKFVTVLLALPLAFLQFLDEFYSRCTLPFVAKLVLVSNKYPKPKVDEILYYIHV